MMNGERGGTMGRIEVDQIEYSIGPRQLFKIPHLSIQPHARIGIVGKNGSGKSTLFKILSGILKPDFGHVNREGVIAHIPQFSQWTSHLSGGEMMRKYISEALEKKADFLFADEPTTHLDVEGIKLLESEIKNFAGACLIISHDRTFLKQTCQTIWEINDQTVSVFNGGYDAYIQQKKDREKQAWEDYHQYEQKKKQLEQAIKHKQQRAQSATKVPKGIGAHEAANFKHHYQGKQKKLDQNAKTMQKRLDQLEVKHRPESAESIQLSLPFADKLKNKPVIHADYFSKSIKDEVLWKDAYFYINGGDKIGLVGANGSGKSTLLKAIVEGEENLNLSSSLRIGYLSQKLNELDEEKDILDFIKGHSEHEETLIRTVLARMHFRGDAVYKKIAVLSGGEKVKVALCQLILSPFNLLILDEPTNSLDIESIEALEQLLKDYTGTNIIVSHDREFLTNVTNKILYLANYQLKLFNEDYAHFVKTLEQPESTKDKTQLRNQLMLVENRISDILSRLSIAPSEELDAQFQAHLKEKRAILKELEE